jgi:hypothetical protein
MRPGHIHLYVQAKGYRPLITQIYDSACPYVLDDAVWAVKDSLIVNFKDIGENKTELEVRYPCSNSMFPLLTIYFLVVQYCYRKDHGRCTSEWDLIIIRLP